MASALHSGLNLYPSSPPIILPPIAGYVGHFDPSDTNTLTLTGTTTVSAMADKSGNGNHMTATGTPLLMKPSSSSRRSMIWFIGTANYLRSNVSRSDATSAAFGVAYFPFRKNYPTFIGQWSGTGGLQAHGDATGLLSIYNSEVGSFGTNTSPLYPAAQSFAFGWTLSTTNWSIWINASRSDGTWTASPTGGKTTVLGRNGDSFGNSDATDGLIGEVIMYDTTLSTADGLTTIQYLMNKWSIA